MAQLRLYVDTPFCKSYQWATLFFSQLERAYCACCLIIPSLSMLCVTMLVVQICRAV